MHIWLQNKLFYTWLRVAELRNIQAAKRIVAQRRRQKLKLARLLRPELPLLASWEPHAAPHADAVAGLASALSAACTSVPVTSGAQVRHMHTYIWCTYIGLALHLSITLSGSIVS